jgi:glyoxylase-like metal-dependent hydrolase (beta-lactamase superfamily II)
MWRRILIVFGIAVLAAAAVAGYQFYRFQRTELVKIDDRFYVVLGGGGNSAILIGDDGVLVVDTKLLRPGQRLAQIIHSLTDKPVKVIVNTHYHADHTHGNPNYAPGPDVIAHRRTRQHLIELDKDFWEVQPNWSMLPADLLDDDKQVQFGDETVRIIHAGRGHTDGDVVVYFTRRGIMHCGDLFFRDLYPSIDLRGGGSARAWPATLDRVLALDGVRQYIPGHGPLSTRSDLVRFQSYLRSLVNQVEPLVAQGKSLADIEAAVDLRSYDDFQGLPFFTSRARNIESVYQELTGKGN